MSIDKSGSPDPLVAGTDITYTLHAHNAGPSTAPNVTIRDFLPDSVTVLSVNGGAGGSCVPGVPGDAGQPTRCAYATLAPTATATMVIVVRVKPGDHRVVTNEATVSSDVLDPDTSNNSASATTTIRVADLKLVKTSDADVYKPSSQITYTLTVTNNGPGDAENVVVTDALPLSGNDRVAVLDSSCTLAGTVATCSLGTISSARDSNGDDRDHPQGQVGIDQQHRDRLELDLRSRHVEQHLDKGRSLRQPTEALEGRLAVPSRRAASAALLPLVPLENRRNAVISLAGGHCGLL